MFLVSLWRGASCVLLSASEWACGARGVHAASTQAGRWQRSPDHAGGHAHDTPPTLDTLHVPCAHTRRSAPVRTEWHQS